MAKEVLDPTVDDPVVKRMLANYKLSADAEAENRKKFIFAQKFRQGGETQWEPAMLTLRQSGNRPTESYNQIPQFLHQVTNDMRMNMPQTRFVAGSDGSEKTAEVYEDLARAIQASSEGEVAYDAAADNQVTGGWGYWRYLTKYENEKTFDQIITLGWIPNPLMVYDDPNATEQDFSDRKFLVHVFDMPKDDFNKEYFDEDEDNYYNSDLLEDIGQSAPDWATEHTVRVAEYWEVTYKRSTLYRTKDGKITDSKPKGTIADEDKRDVMVPKVMWYKCTARHKLDEKEWPGIYIPYVRASGEMQIIDGRTYYTGLVEGMISPQKQYNYWSNTATEIMGLAPISPWIMAAGQQEGFEDMWANANIRKTPYLLYNPMNVLGQPVAPPNRNNAGADISGALALVQQAQQNFYTTTGIYPASLGQQSNEKSGKAILARQKEGDVSTFHFSDNMARALRFGGRILADLFPKIYDGTRMIKVMKEDKSTREVKINAPTKKPNGKTEHIDMTTGTYDVMVTTGPSFTTRRQESAEAMMQMAQSTNLMEVAPDLLFQNQDWPGAEEIAKRYKKLLPPNITEDENESPIPPQVKNQMEQMGQVIQQLQAGMQQAEQQLADKSADIANKQADLEIKKQQAQYNEADAQRQSQLDFDKNKLEREKMAFELLKMQMVNVQGSNENGEKASDMPDVSQLLQTFTDDENVLTAMMGSLAQKRQEDAQNQQMMQDMALQEQATRSQQADLEMQNEQQKAMIAQANLEKLDEIQVGLAMLVNAITAKKVVERDPITGMATGVVTVGNA